MASLFTGRAISYRVDKGFGHFKGALSVSVQRMVRSDRGASGVMFTLDTESGFKNVVLINASWGLGEMVVQGAVNPDEYYIAKSLLDKAPSPIISKQLGTKARKLVYAEKRGGLRPVRVKTTSPKERRSFVLEDREILT